MQRFYITLAIIFGVPILFAIWRRIRGGRSDGPVSIVILRGKPRSLTNADVRGAVRRALKQEAKVEPLPMPDGLTTGFIVIPDNTPPIAVIDSTRTYGSPDEVEQTAASFEDERARDAYKAHNAWISIDALGLKKTPSAAIRAQIYNKILGKLAAELLDDESLLLYLPREERFGLNTPEAAQLLAGEKVSEVFADDSLQEPIIHVGNDEQAINAAIAKAREKLPEFVAAFNRLGEASTGLVKGKFTAPDGAVEYMWIKVTAASPTAITGEVVNRPAHKALPRQGTIVDLTPEDVGDWAYVDEKKKPHGMFVERILRKG